MKKWVKQIDVARQLGIDRTTVNKILNNYPAKFGEQTRQKVFETASRIGYLHPAVVVPKRRAAPRKELKAKVSIKVRLQNGSLFSECQGEVVNISTTGMLLKSAPGGQLPTEPFYLEINLTRQSQAFELKARPVRFASLGRPTPAGKQLGLGVEFIDIPEDDDRLLKLIAQAKERYQQAT